MIGIILVVLEFVINVKANLNLIIFHSFRGNISEIYQVVNFQWLLFYPCVYAFSPWHAYNQAAAVNQETGESKLNGVFLGCAFGGTLGVIYSYSIGPVFTGIIGGAAGALLGSLIEYLMDARKE